MDGIETFAIYRSTQTLIRLDIILTIVFKLPFRSEGKTYLINVVGKKYLINVVGKTYLINVVHFNLNMRLGPNCF